MEQQLCSCHTRNGTQGSVHTRPMLYPAAPVPQMLSLQTWAIVTALVRFPGFYCWEDTP